MLTLGMDILIMTLPKKNSGMDGILTEKKLLQRCIWMVLLIVTF